MVGGAPETNDILDGTPYRALSELGKGGMGSVHLAEHRVLKKRLAVKLLHAELGDQEELTDRLRVEAEALATLSSPHVVEVLDCGLTSAGAPYIAMELLIGRNLQEVLGERGWLPAREALELVRQATAGIMAAHALGIVHRDLKPANLFLCRRSPSEPPLLKVLDFGVAKILGGPVAPPHVATAPQTLIGSPKTMSPEAWLGEPVDERSDVYALGVVLYTLLVGHGPFEGRNDLAGFARAHVSELPAPPSSVARQPISPELDALVLEALEKDPRRRFQSARHLHQALERLLDPALVDPVEDTARAALRVQAARASGAAPVGGTRGEPREAVKPSTTAHPPRVIVTSLAASEIAPRPSQPAGSRHPSAWLPRTIAGVTVLIAIGVLGFVLGRSAERTLPTTASAAASTPSSSRISSPPSTTPSESPLASATGLAASPPPSPSSSNRAAPETPPRAPTPPSTQRRQPVSKTASSAAAPRPTSEFYE